MKQIPERVIERFRMRYQEDGSGCWLWTGATNGVGYGRIAWTEDGRGVWALAHRVSYAIAYGGVTDSLDLDHICHDPAACDGKAACPHRRCVNPAHLRPVSRRENLLRGGGVAADRRAVTECPHGHPYSESNTYIDKQGRRSCRECTRIANRAYYHKNKARRAEYNRRWRAARQPGASG